MNVSEYLSDLKNSYQQLEEVYNQVFDRYTSLILGSTQSVDKSVEEKIVQLKETFPQITSALEPLFQLEKELDALSYQEGESTEQMLARMQNKHQSLEIENKIFEEGRKLDSSINSAYALVKQIVDSLEEIEKLERLRAFKEQLKQNKNED